MFLCQVFCLFTIFLSFQDDLSGIKEQLFPEFLPDDAYPFGAPLFMETPRPCSPLAQTEFQAFEEVIINVLHYNLEVTQVSYWHGFLSDHACSFLDR